MSETRNVNGLIDVNNLYIDENGFIKIRAETAGK